MRELKNMTHYAALEIAYGHPACCFDSPFLYRQALHASLAFPVCSRSSVACDCLFCGLGLVLRQRHTQNFASCVCSESATSSEIKKAYRAMGMCACRLAASFCHPPVMPGRVPVAREYFAAAPCAPLARASPST